MRGGRGAGTRVESFGSDGGSDTCPAGTTGGSASRDSSAVAGSSNCGTTRAGRSVTLTSTGGDGDRFAVAASSTTTATAPIVTHSAARAFFGGLADCDSAGDVRTIR